VSLPLDQVERAVARLWEDEARASGGTRVELLTLVVLVSEPRLLDRARKVVSEVVRSYPSRTIVAVWREGEPPSISADVALHRAPGGVACGDAISLEAVGAAREWLPGNAERLALSDLPVCVWWVGDLPDFDDLFDRMVVGADLVVVNSGEMDLRDLEKLSNIARRSRDRYAMADLTWIRLRTLKDLVARFFDDAEGRACLGQLDRVTIEFSPRPDEKDVASTQAGLFLGWVAAALGWPTHSVVGTRGEGWAEVKVGRATARFEQKPRSDVRPGVITRIAMDAANAHFEIERQEDPRVYRWSRDVPGVVTAAQMLRVGAFEEPSLLVRCLERPKRDKMFEKSLDFGRRIVRPVAPRLSLQPAGD
jgi:glucose-6-phosphate dehydrogenase assembly protein OpcA